jgi:hypothetical protein
MNVLSLTQHVHDWLANTQSPRVLHVFDRACNLINEHGEVLSIVTPQIGNGPFNLVLEHEVLFSERLNLESVITVHENQLHLGEMIINLAGASLWHPYPHWDTFHCKRNEIAEQLQQLEITDHKFSNSLSSCLVHAELESSKHDAQSLAGLGMGLTPAGDDFIIGALYATWIIHPKQVASILAEQVANAAAPLTTSLSAAWLRAAGRGEAGILWHTFFDTLISAGRIAPPACGGVADPTCAMNKILAVGATSGADALAGFISTFISYMEFDK